MWIATERQHGREEADKRQQEQGAQDNGTQPQTRARPKRWLDTSDSNDKAGSGPRIGHKERAMMNADHQH